MPKNQKHNKLQDDEGPQNSIQQIKPELNQDDIID
jgi:hypothetical protein